MSQRNDNPGQNRAADDENYVDRERRRDILDARREVREWRKQIFTELRLGTAEYGEQEALMVFGDRVREYLLVLEPLLGNETLPKSQLAYLNYRFDPVILGPPEELVAAAKDGGRPSQSEKSNGSDFSVIGELPEPEAFSFNGLKKIIETETITAQWTVYVRWDENNNGNDRREKITRSKTVPLPKWLLRDAVRLADEWAQQANLGLELGTPEIDAVDDEPF